MATTWKAPTWRMPNDKNQSKFESYSIDFNGMDREQREQALKKAHEYVVKNSVFKMGAKGVPGLPCDCSGLVAHSMIAGGEIVNPYNFGTWHIENKLEERGIEDVQKGNAFTITYIYPASDENGDPIIDESTGQIRMVTSKHSGIIADWVKDKDGNIKKLIYYNMSTSKGVARKSEMSINYFNIHDGKIFKWDKIPETPASLETYVPPGILPKK